MHVEFAQYCESTKGTYKPVACQSATYLMRDLCLYYQLD
jgi:hypothetical protein